MTNSRKQSHQLSCVYIPASGRDALTVVKSDITASNKGDRAASVEQVLRAKTDTRLQRFKQVTCVSLPSQTYG